MEWKVIGFPILLAIWGMMMLAANALIKDNHKIIVGSTKMFAVQKFILIQGGNLFIASNFSMYIFVHGLLYKEWISIMYLNLFLGLVLFVFAIILILAWARYRVQIGQDELAVRGLLRGWQRWRWEDLRNPRATLAFYPLATNVLEVEASGKRVRFHLDLLGSRELFKEIVEEVQSRSAR